MSERKVLNKYYPPDFDPSKLPKLRQSRDRQYTVRIMAPFNMQCKTCGEYIYKGKKFNAKTENVSDESYLGLRIYRFYIKCPKCISEINFKTDPENTDYTLEHGATRLFEASKAYQKQEEQEKREKEEEEANNPMKVLENRTKDSKLEMEVIENLEELRDLNTRHANVNYADILKQKAEEASALLKKQEEDDEAEIRKYFGKTQEGPTIKRLINTEEDEEESASPSGSSSTRSNKRPTDFLTEDSPEVSPSVTKKQKTSWDVSIGGLSSKSKSIAGLVRVKKPPQKSSSGNKTEPSESRTISESNAADLSSHKSASDNSTTELKLQNCKSDKQQAEGSRTLGTKAEEQDDSATVGPLDSVGIMDSIKAGLVKQQKKQAPRVKVVKSGGLSLLGGYADDSESDVSSESD